DKAPSKESGGRWRDHGTRLASPTRKSDVGGANVSFPTGLPGLARAIRAWRNRPYDTTSAEWEPERFANVIGYRLSGLLAEGRVAVSRSALRSLADGSG